MLICQPNISQSENIFHPAHRTVLSTHDFTIPKILSKKKISTAERATDSMIFLENEMNRICGISRMTVRSVITRFVTEGLLYKIRE